MDLYEALKAGTSPDELERKFQEELAAARKKYYAEEDLNDTREELAAEIIEYLSLVIDKEFVKNIAVKDIVEALKSIEKDLKASSLFLRNLDRNKKTTGSFYAGKSDDELIKDFLANIR